MSYTTLPLTLSPAEQAEVTRFGVHDEDILRDMQEHMYDVPVCDGCDLRAAVRLVHSCGHHVDLACAVHHADIHDYVSSRLVGARRGVSCAFCDARFRHPQTVADVYTEVPL